MYMCLYIIHTYSEHFVSVPFSLPLEGMKRKIMRNLRTLETEGMVNSKNDYQEIINAIAKVSCSAVLYTVITNWQDVKLLCICVYT